jgi:glyoxylase-like metal-dependent hydrolase (beta-lactamase superfamily II)
LIIDTGGGEPAWAELISSTLKSMDITLSHVLLTHWHGDHTGGVPDLIRHYPYLEDAIYKNDPNGTQQDITDGQLFVVEGATVRALHVPGHSEDHMCFILEEEMAMFTGDNILGHGTSVVEDLGTFMASIHRMGEQACGTGYSAHGVTIADLPAKINSELDSRYRRERQVVAALKSFHSRGQRSASVGDVVLQIYGTAVSKETRAAALEPFINEVLCKLAGDFKIAFQFHDGTKKWYFIEGVKRHTLHTAEIAAPRLMDIYAA